MGLPPLIAPRPPIMTESRHHPPQPFNLRAHYSRVSSCGTFSVIVEEQTPVGPVFVQYRASCSSRFCPVCSHRRSRLWQRKIIGSFRSSKCVMITLTFDDRAPDPYENPRYYSSAWDTFLKRLRRRYPRLRFARMVELHESGRPHFHVLVDRYIPQRYVSWAFDQCGGGQVAYCQFVPPGRSARYVTKYVNKSLDPDGGGPRFFFLSRMRSVSTSRGLFYVVPRKPGSSFYCHDTTASCSLELRNLANGRGIIPDRVFIDDPRAPPFIWRPDTKQFHPDLNTRMSFPLTYAHLLAWSLDLSALPSDDSVFILFPPGLSSERVQHPDLLPPS